jgi:hypothetical protein
VPGDGIDVVAVCGEIWKGIGGRIIVDMLNHSENTYEKIKKIRLLTPPGVPDRTYTFAYIHLYLSINREDSKPKERERGLNKKEPHLKPNKSPS